MKSFRDPKYVKRYEYVTFDLETALNKLSPIMPIRRKMAIGLFLITVERLHHLTGIMLESVLILK